MSQTLDSAEIQAPDDTEAPEQRAETAASGWTDSVDRDDFSFVPLSPWGPIALVMGVCSLTAGLFGVFGLVLAALGIIIGIVAVVRIRGTAGTERGTGMAVGGIVLSTVSLIGGTALLMWLYSVECPEGYTRVNFPNEISEYEFQYFGSRRRLAPEVAPLIGKKIFIKGFMWNTQKDTGLESFVFLKDNGECCFGGSPQPYDMMVVTMAGEDVTTDAFTSMIAVGGVLRANVNAEEGQPVYTIEADFVERAKTSF